MFYTSNQIDGKENNISYLKFSNSYLNEIDVYADDNIISRNLKFNSYTGLTAVKSGMYRIRIFESNSKSEALIDVNIYFIPDKIITAELLGCLDNASIKLVYEDIKEIEN